MNKFESEYDDIIGKVDNTEWDKFFAVLTSDELLFISRFPVEIGAVNKKDRVKYERVLKLLVEGDRLPIPPPVYNLALKASLARQAPIQYNEFDLHASVYSKGAAVFHTKETLVIQKASGDIIEVKNTVMPDPNGVKRAGLMSIVTATSAFIKLEKGVILLSFNDKEFLKAWDKKTVPFYPDHVADFVRVFSGCVSKQPEFLQIVTDKKTLSKGALLDFIKQSYVRMSDHLYFMLHTVFVHEFLQIFVPDEKKSAKYTYTTKRYKCGDELRVPSTSYTKVTADVDPEIVKAIRKRKYREVFIYLGGIPNAICFTASGTLQGAIKARQRSISVRGSEKTALSFISSGYGYSGLTTPASRRVMRAVSMAGAALAKGCATDIQLYKANDLPLIFSSLKKHFPDGDWKVILPFDNQVEVSLSHRGCIIPHGRDGSHLIVYHARGMNSYAMKEKDGNEDYVQLSMNNYKQDSAKWAPRDIHPEYTVYTSIYGDYPFKKPGAPPSKDKFYSSPAPKQQHYVYRLGYGDNFLGIISTTKDLKLYGIEARVIESPESSDTDSEASNSASRPPPASSTATTADKTSASSAKASEAEDDWDDEDDDEDEEGDYEEVECEERRRIETKPTEVALRVCDSESDWYNWVIASNSIREGYWCNAKPLYSPISNVIFPPRSGVDVVNKLYQDDFDNQDDAVFGDLMESEEEAFDEEFVSEAPPEDEEGKESEDEKEEKEEKEEVFLPSSAPALPPKKKKKVAPPPASESKLDFWANS